MVNGAVSQSRSGTGRSGTGMGRVSASTGKLHSRVEKPGSPLSLRIFLLVQLFWLLLQPGVIGAEAEREEVVGVLGLSVSLDPNITIDSSKNEILWTFKASNKSEYVILDHIPGVTTSEPSEQFKDRLQFNASSGALTISRLNASDQGDYTFTVDGKELKIKELLVIGQNATEVYGSPGSSVIFPGVDEKETDITVDFLSEKLQGKETSMDPVLQFHIGSTKPAVVNKYIGRIDFFPSNGSFIFSNLTSADDGLYRLSINLPKTMIRYVRLHIMDKLSKPSIWINGSSLHSTIQLSCNVDGDSPSYQWWKDGREVSLDQLMDSNKSLVIRSASRRDCGTYTCDVTNPVNSVQANYWLNIHGLLLADIIIVVSSITGIISSTVSLTGLIILYYLSRELKQGSQKPLFICNDLSLVTISIALIFRIVIKGAASEPVVVLVVVFALLAFNVCLAVSFWNLGCECVRKVLNCTDLRTLINFCGIMSSIIVLVFSIVILAEEIHQSNRGCHVTYLTWSTLSLLFTVVAIIFSACFTVLWKGGEGSSRESEHQVTPQEEDEGQARNERIGITAGEITALELVRSQHGLYPEERLLSGHTGDELQKKKTLSIKDIHIGEL